eukprot:TRINITY_DN21828_c0_g1_i2.p1 TRINITY_DN21828_c0_g1~~TRINITY_DN21828_c0_g1_i2.p1  ORF type:complete len:372 (-),score=67.86 TRINITY_DN21828_c0_g1_i2:85-1200(-)
MFPVTASSTSAPRVDTSKHQPVRAGSYGEPGQGPYVTSTAGRRPSLEGRPSVEALRVQTPGHEGPRLPFPADRETHRQNLNAEVPARSRQALEMPRRSLATGGAQHPSQPSSGSSSATYTPAGSQHSPAVRDTSPAFLLRPKLPSSTASTQAQDSQILPELDDDTPCPAYNEKPFGCLISGHVDGSPIRPKAVEEPFPKPSPGRSLQQQSQEEAEENTYLRRNVEHLRNAKRQLEQKNKDLEARCQALEQRKQQYKMLYEQALKSAQSLTGGSMEINSLHQQLSAMSLLKDALNQEIMELHRRLEECASSNQDEAGSKQATCVICMDNLANLVCLPCKHLAICAYCGKQADLSECPICRSPVTEKMQIFTP